MNAEQGAPILAADRWPSNAELIADVARLYIRPTDRVLDVTFGRGVWWRKYQHPGPFAAYSTEEGTDWATTWPVADFTALPDPDASADVIAYDPPYVCVGGRQTTTLPELHARYGLTDAPTTPDALRRLIAAGLSEVYRVLVPRGVALVKVQDYVTSGRLFAGTYWLQADALALGFEVVDRFEHIGNPRPQPPGRRQLHARRNLSTLFVLRKVVGR